MKFIFANDTYINVDQIFWVESRINPDDEQAIVTVQFQDKKLTWAGAKASAFMREWYDVIAPADT